MPETNAKQHTIVVISGDGIGPEVTDATLEVLQAAGAPLNSVSASAGLSALKDGFEVLPDRTLDLIREHGVALKGPCTTPVGDGFTSVNVQLRQKLDLFAAIRPVRSLPGVATRYDDVDLVIFRENTEGMYAGIENDIIPGVVSSMKIITEKACTRIAQRAFEYIRKRGRQKLMVFHKANIMKKTDGMFLRCVKDAHEANFSDIEYETMIIDAGCMRIVQDPTRFDVLLMENFYGDIISDLTAGLVGGLGVVPGANIGENTAVFEAVHGSAPDIAGQGIANPLALMMSSVMMLNHLAESRNDDACHHAADRIKTAYNQALLDGQKTGDLGGSLNTQGFAQAIIERLS